MSSAPTIFQLSRISPLLFGFLLLLIGAGWVLLFDDHWKGLRTMSYSLVGGGIFLLVIFGVFDLLFKQANKPTGFLGQLNENGFSRSMSGVASDLVAQTNRVILWFGIIYVVIGGVTWLSLKFILKKPEAIKTK